MRSTLPSVGLIAAVYVVTLSALEREGLWQIDNANKLLQLQAILLSGGEDFSLPWPGLSLDPSIEYNPIPHLFSRVEDGKLYSVFSPVFALVSSVPYSILGQTGLYVLPLVASLIMLLGIGRLAERMRDATGSAAPPASRHVAVLLAGLCTPIWFYSVVFWEHTIATCLCVWSICSAVAYGERGTRAALATAAVLAALSVYFRDELYIFCLLIAVLVASFDRKRRWRHGLGVLGLAAISLGPLWVFQWHTIGHPLGFHLGAHLLTVAGGLDHLVTRPDLIFNLLLSSTPIPVLSIPIAVPFVVALLLRPGKVDAAPIWVLGASLLGAGAALSGYFVWDSPIGYMLHSSNSLFVAAPFMVLGLSRRWTWNEPEPVVDVRRCVWLVVTGFVLLYVLAAPEFGSRGIHWGNRYLLLVYPLCTALAAGKIVATFADARVTRARARPLIVLGLIALSCAAQLYSVHLLEQKKDLSHRLNEAIAERQEEIIVTTVRWASQALFANFYDKVFMYVDSPESLDKLAARLEQSGRGGFLLLTPPIADPVPSTVLLEDTELRFFSLALTPGEAINSMVTPRR